MYSQNVPYFVRGKESFVSCSLLSVSDQKQAGYRRYYQILLGRIGSFQLFTASPEYFEIDEMYM